MKAAFTLIELLIVVAVIALLAGIAIPVFSKLTNSAHIATSTSNLSQLAAANLAYAADNEGNYCPAQDQRNLVRWHGARTSTNSAFDPAKGFLAGYLGTDGRVKRDPTFTNYLGEGQSFEDGSGGYGYNSSYIGGTPQNTFQPSMLSRVGSPARTVMFTTTALAMGSGAQEYPFCEPPFWDFGSGPSDYRPTPSVHFRANGKALVAWCDGHVTAESKIDRTDGYNPYNGDAESQHLGWFGPDTNNGYWNPASGLE